MTEPNDRVATVVVPGGRVHTWKVGGGPGTPLIVIHGGPGFPHDYLENVGQLGTDRAVVFWDQLGCGQSERPTDASLWHLERFVEELEKVHAATTGAEENVVLLGHSWGSMLAVDFALRHPDRVSALVLDSPVLSASRFSEDVGRLFDALPEETRRTLRQHEAAGTTDSEAYGAAYGQFIARHLLRLDPFPEPVMRALKGKGHIVYETMWGPSEFTFTGNLNTYERMDRMARLAKPVLYVVGEHDEVVPATVRAYAAATPGSEFAVIENASHLKNLEQPARYLGVVRDFLQRQDRSRTAQR
jgi:proline iminopeptidase